MLLNCGVGEDSWESLGQQGDQSVNPKGNPPWIFIGTTDAEAEAPILQPPDAKNWLIWKNPDAGEDWRWEEKGTTEDEMIGWHHWLNGHGFEKLQELVMTGRPGVLQSMGSQRVRYNWATELNWTEQVRISKGKRCIRESPHETIQNSPHAPSHWRHLEMLLFHPEKYVTIFVKWCWPRQLTWALVQGWTEGHSCSPASPMGLKSATQTPALQRKNSSSP